MCHEARRKIIKIVLLINSLLLPLVNPLNGIKDDAGHFVKSVVAVFETKFIA